jgi:acetyltransferase-like isoleucine patch superfamily enzyme
MRALVFLMAAAGVAAERMGVLFWSTVARVRLQLHGARVGRRLRVRGPLRLHCHRSASIRIGHDCRIQSGFPGNPVGGCGRMGLWVGPGGRLTLGDRVGLSNSTIVCMNAVAIENGALVGGGCRIYDTNFHALDPDDRDLPGNIGVRTAPVTVGQRAFVGGHSLILKGVRIGAESVVGAGSVVRTDVPDGEIWAGNPARFLRALPSREACPAMGIETAR